VRIFIGGRLDGLLRLAWGRIVADHIVGRWVEIKPGSFATLRMTELGLRMTAQRALV
jgi:hypothetical protein